MTEAEEETGITLTTPSSTTLTAPSGDTPPTPASPSRANFIQSFAGHTEPILSLAIVDYAKTDTTFLTASQDHTIKLWHLTLNAPEPDGVNACTKTFIGHEGAVSEIVIFGNDKFLSGSEDGTVKLWELSSAAEEKKQQPPQDTEVEAQEEKCLQTFQSSNKEGAVKCITMVNGTQFLTGLESGTIHLWSLPNQDDTNEDDKEATTTTTTTIITPVEMKGHAGAVTCLSLLAGFNTQNVFLSGSEDGTIKLWDLTKLNVPPSTNDEPADATSTSNTSACIQTFSGHGNTITSLSILSSSTFLSSSHDGTACLWDIPTSSCLQTYTSHRGPLTSLQFLNGEDFLTSSEDGTCVLWNADDGRVLKRFEGHEGGVTGVAVLGGEEGWFVSSSVDGTVKLWKGLGQEHGSGDGGGEEDGDFDTNTGDEDENGQANGSAESNGTTNPTQQPQEQDEPQQPPVVKPVQTFQVGHHPVHDVVCVDKNRFLTWSREGDLDVQFWVVDKVDYDDLVADRGGNTKCVIL